MKTRSLIGLLIIFLVLTSCSTSNSNEDIHVGQLYLRSEVTAFGGKQHLFRAVDWSGGDAVIGELDNERIPEWAKGFARSCVHWEDDFTRSLLQNSESAESQTIVQHGHAQGWILIGERPNVFYILELTVEFEGITYDWIDAWEAPE